MQPFSYPMTSPPEIRISRVRNVLTNPSWLWAVTSIMLSDTGIFLNWNPTTALSQNRHGTANEDAKDQERAVALQYKQWEDEFEESLGDIERLGDSCYDSM